MPSCTLIWFLCKSFQKKIFYVNGYLNNLHRFVLLCFFFHSRHVLGVKDIYCAFEYGLFYVPKHSFIVPLFLHVVNRLYILSSAFCCWSVVHRESATRFKNICSHFGLLIPMVPDGSQHNFCDKIKFVFLFVKLKMYCPLYGFPLNAVLINYNLITRACMDLTPSEDDFLGYYLSFQYHVLPALQIFNQ